MIAFAGILLVSCSSPIRLSNYPDSSQDFKSSPNTSAASQRATMRPYTINGKTYYPTTVSVGDTALGIASWYGPNFHGKKTSNGETYNMNAMTAAHKTLPMNTMVRVTNLSSGAQTTVRINDRGPFVAGRIIDLSKAAATSIGMIGAGTARVKLEVVGFYGDGKNYQNTGSLSSPPSVSNSKNWGSGVSGAIITSGISSSNKASKNSANFGKISQGQQSFEGGSFMVQIGAFKRPEGAKSFKNSNANKYGYKTLIRTFDIDGEKIYRVFLSGFRSEAEARDFVKAKHFGGAYIVRE
ncbi:MAG: septal ring lytic transglycosylase RlpA family protein [Campylobacter sp.]